MARKTWAASGWLGYVVVAMAGAGCAVVDDPASAPDSTPDEDALVQQTQRELDAAAVAAPATFASVRPVRPTLKCVENLGNRQYRAHFGYTNSAPSAIAIPVGFLNRFWPPPAGRGQPTTFAPGAQADVVQVSFRGADAALWVLGNHFVIATRFSRPCLAGGAGGAAGAGGAGGGAGGAIPSCPSTCDDHNPCTVDVCNAGTGYQCVSAPALDGSACDDGNPCTLGDACQAGACVATAAKQCLPADECHAPGVCDPATGACSNPARPDGTQCTSHNRCGAPAACQAGTCAQPPATVCSLACDQCTFGVQPGQPDLCSSTVEACFNCAPEIVDCQGLPSAADRTLCEDLFACLAAPTHPGTTIPGACTTFGDPFACWCGTNPTTCVTANAPPLQANGPCLQQIFAAAKTTDAATINLHFIDPNTPLGRAVNLINCQDVFCPQACQLPVPPPPCPTIDACHLPGVRDPVTGVCAAGSPRVDGSTCDDHDGCTTSDTCQSGICVGGPVCPPDPCRLSNTCDPQSHQCIGTPQPDGTPCQVTPFPSCSVGGVCSFGRCLNRAFQECPALCEQCTFGVAPGQTDLCSGTNEGCFNCFPGTDGCQGITDAGDRALCDSLYACLVAPTHPGTVVPGPCISQGDPYRCWCGTNLTTCVTDNAPPTQANGPCLQQIFAAAKSTDAAFINLHFIDPNTSLGRAVNLAACRSNFCSPECGVNF